MLMNEFYRLCLEDAPLDALLSVLIRLFTVDGAAIEDTHGNLLAQTGVMPPDGTITMPLAWKNTPVGLLRVNSTDNIDIPQLVRISLAGQIYSFCKRTLEKDARLLLATEREEIDFLESAAKECQIAPDDTFFLLYIDINDLDEQTVRSLYEEVDSLVPTDVDSIALNGKEMSVLYRNPRKSQEAFFQALSRLLQRYEIRGALSQPFDGQRLSKHLYLLKLAIRAGSTIYPEQFLFRFDSLASFILFLALQSNMRIANYYSEEVLHIINYDYENETEFSRSLYVYLFYFMSLKEAAKDMRIHRNTLDYHIKKIGQILGVLPNASQRFEMMCTYGMLAMGENE